MASNNYVPPTNNLLQSFSLYGQNDVLSGYHAQGSMCTNMEIGVK